MKLYELTSEYVTAIEKYNQAENQEELDAIAQHLDSLSVSLKEKSIAVAHHIINVEADQESIKREIERLKIHLDRSSKQSEWFREYLSKSLLSAGVEKVEDAGLKLSFRASTRTEIIDESLVPELYKKTKIVQTVDKDAIKKAWESGVGVEGTQVVKAKNLQIK